MLFSGLTPRKCNHLKCLGYSEIFALWQMWNNSLRELWNMILRIKWNEIRLLTFAKQIFHSEAISIGEAKFHSPQANFVEKREQVFWLALFFLAPPAGLEPATSWLTVMRSANWAKEEYLSRDSLEPLLCWHLPIFPARRHASIVGTTELNFCVRNGNRWTLCVNLTNFLLYLSLTTACSCNRGNRLLSGCTFRDSNPGPTD